MVSYGIWYSRSCQVRPPRIYLTLGIALHALGDRTGMRNGYLAAALIALLVFGPVGLGLSWAGPECECSGCCQSNNISTTRLLSDEPQGHCCGATVTRCDLQLDPIHLTGTDLISASPQVDRKVWSELFIAPVVETPTAQPSRLSPASADRSDCLVALSIRNPILLC